ncbi:MAG TPA: bacillithiol biosynthesis cysteine-adding enzyme BshC, partial [Vicinamibacterales bacterium]|nr:bacillithiol biosynthesis cysteine-adding enzyme BshC [Vicinamibacterales bacterium]
AAEQVPVVPVFWVASEDHDWDEVRSTTVVTADDAAVKVTAPDVEGAGLRPVGALTFDERITRTLADLDAALPRSTWTSDLLASLRHLYAPGGDPGTALAGWLDQLLGRHGLVVFDGADPCAKPLAASLFADELEHPERTAGLVREMGEKLRALGHPPQLVPAEHATALFYLDAHGRHPIRFARDAFVIGETRRTRADLVAEAHAHPERFSPNVMLRPVVQDCLFPTICYVAGPGELAYHAQLGGVYAACGVERPLLASRASATIVDAATARFLDRHGLSLDRLSASDDSVLNAIVRREIDPAVGRILDEAAQAIDGRLDAVRTVTTTVDPTLAATADTARRRVRQTFDTLHDKIVRAVKRRDGTLRRQFTHARTTAFPDGSPQDRVLGVAAILNQYGPSLVDHLLEQLPTDARCHYVVVP